MPKHDPPKAPSKNRKRRKYSKPSITKHGELPSTALAHSY